MIGITRASATLAIGQLRKKGLLLPTRNLATNNLEALLQAAYTKG